MRVSRVGGVARLLLASLLLLAATLVVAAGWLIAAPPDDAVDSPDVVVVLGGAGQERADLGIELQRRYDVPLVLSSSARSFAAERGVGCPPAVCITTDPETTAGEARGVARLAETYGWDRVAVVTSEFHARRARLLFRQCFGDRVAVVGADALDGEGVQLLKHLRELIGLIAGATFVRAC